MTERERESQRLGLRYNDLAGALAFALDVILPLKDRQFDHKWCSVCGETTNHRANDHDRIERGRADGEEPNS